MYYYLKNLGKYLCIISAASNLYAADDMNQDRAGLSGRELRRLESSIISAAQRRKSTIKNYATETGMNHLPMMFADNDEIQAKYGNADEDDIIDFSTDLESDSGSDSETVPTAKSSKKTSKTAKKRPRVIEEDDEAEKVAPAPKRIKAARGISFPKFNRSKSVHTNPDIGTLQGTIIVYDSETSALSPKCGGRLVELAAIKIIDGIPRETLHILFNPDMKSWAGAFKAHGLHESYLRAQAHFYDVAKQIEDFFGQDIRCAHNGYKFDDPYLNFEMTRAKVFWQLRQMLTPQQDFSDKAPRSALLTADTIEKGHAVLKEFGLISEGGIQENLQEKANLLSAAAMLYFYKDHMTKVTTGTDAEPKPGPLMFRDGKIMPGLEAYPENHEAAVARLAWFRLIRQDTDTLEQRALLKQPYTKFIRDAIQSAEVYLSAVVKIFETNVLDEVAFQTAPLDKAKMFDTLVHVRAHPQQFTRGFSVDNLKLDSLIDYYHLNRHARETGTHGAAIDTSLLYQVLRKLVGAQDGVNPALQVLLAKSQTDIEELLFEKNSIRHFNEAGQITATVKLHDDQIPGTTRDRNGRRNIGLNTVPTTPPPALSNNMLAANSNAAGIGAAPTPPTMIPLGPFGYPHPMMMCYNPFMMAPYQQTMNFNPFAMPANHQQPAGSSQMAQYPWMENYPQQQK